MEAVYPDRGLVWDDIVYEIQEILGHPSDVYLVGGMVRDAYLGRAMKDIDLATDGDGQLIARQLANAFKGAYYPLDAERGVGRAIVEYQFQRWVIDVAALRGNSLHEDLYDRDFTVNAMAVPLDSQLDGILDPLSGIQDLNDKVLRQCSEHSIADDPIRALRAIRQSMAYGLKIEPSTRHAIKRIADQLSTVSNERIRDEFFAMFRLAKPHGALLILDTLGLLNLILPDFAAMKTIQHNTSMNRWRYTLLVMDNLNALLTVISPRRDDNIAANAGLGTVVYMLDRYRKFWQEHLAKTWVDNRDHMMLLLFAVLMNFSMSSLDDIEKCGTDFRLSSHEIKRLQQIFQYDDLPTQLHTGAALTPRQVYRFWRTTGEAGLDACLMAMANYLASESTTFSIAAWTRYLQTIEQLLAGYDAAMQVDMLISGNDLMQHLKLEPGPQIGKILEAVREAQALGEITDADAALAFAQAQLES